MIQSQCRKYYVVSSLTKMPSQGEGRNGNENSSVGRSGGGRRGSLPAVFYLPSLCATISMDMGHLRRLQRAFTTSIVRGGPGTAALWNERNKGREGENATAVEHRRMAVDVLPHQSRKVIICFSSFILCGRTLLLLIIMRGRQNYTTLRSGQSPGTVKGGEERRWRAY